MLGHEDIKNTSVPFLFFANKADAPGALSPVECMQLLEQLEGRVAVALLV